MGETTKNPSWGRDETILALNLFLQNEKRVPRKTDKRIQALSSLLRKKPTHAVFAGRKNFRSPSAVILKIGNLQQEIDGKGMPNNSKIDETVCRELGDRPDEVAILAKHIEYAMNVGAEEILCMGDNDVEFNEGQVYTRVHMARERNSRLRRLVLDDRLKSGRLACEICDLAYGHLPIHLRFSAFEIHHILPLSISGARTVGVADTALLCASCHRLIHKLIAERKTWIEIQEARTLLRKY